MSRYMYALVRCVPNPHTGEFVNIGAIAGDPESGEWSVRQVRNESHARRLASLPVINAAHDLLGRVGAAADAGRAAVETEGAEPMGEEWLLRLHHDHRNVVQLSVPTPMVASDPEEALDLIFEHMIIDENKAIRPVTKARVVSNLKTSYRLLAPGLVHQRPALLVGDHLSATMDFAVANGSALQLTQCWSFQVGGVGEIGTDVKAWAYALGRVRDGKAQARLVTAPNPNSSVPKDVDLQVVIARPETERQREVYEEADQIFGELGVDVHGLDDTAAVAARAQALVAGHHEGPGESSQNVRSETAK